MTRSLTQSIARAIALRIALLTAVLMALGTGDARAAGLLIADGGNGGVLEIQEHEVRVTINNGIAVTDVTQVFKNTEDRQVEALYTFPVPKGASVANFSMWINGKEMVGEVVEKQRAREIYDSYKQVRRDPGLLEQTNYKTFEMRIFPIAPQAEQRVQITYYQELDVDHDWATYVYPLATATRSDIDQRTTGRFAINVDVKSEVPIVEMTSASHDKQFVIANHSESYSQASLETNGGDLGRDVVLAYRTARPHTGIDVVASKPKGEDGYFYLTLTAGEELAQFDRAMDYVFVVDISGSMANDGKLRLSRNAVGAFVGSLGKEDRFDIITFNVKAEALFGQLAAVDEPAQAKAREFLDSQMAQGGTSLNPAMTAAYRYADSDRPLNVIVLSDGMTEQKERAQLMQLIQSRPATARVFCIGVGNEVNRGLLEQVATTSGGLAAFVSTEDNFERQASAFRRKLMRPVASNLKITVDGVDAYDIEPQTLPNLYHGMPVRMYGRYKKGAAASITVRGDVLGKDLTKTVELTLPKHDDENPQIERMWAWHRIDRLLKQSDDAGSRKDVIPEVIRLGEGYSIVTEYTSFLVLENDGEYKRWKIDRRNALRMERDRRSRDQVAMQLEQIRNRAAQNVGPLASAAPVPSNTAAQPAVQPRQGARAPAAQPAAPAPQRSNGSDIDFGNGGGGGGALDPIEAIIAIGLVGAAWAATRWGRNESRS